VEALHYVVLLLNRKLIEVVGDVLQLGFDTLLEVSLQPLRLDLDKAAVRLPTDLGVENLLPATQLLQLGLDRSKVFGLTLPGFEVEVLLERVDHAALLEGFDLITEVLEVRGQMLDDRRLRLMVCLRLLNDGAEARALVVDQAVDEDVEFGMNDDARDLLSDGLHVCKDLLSVSDEVCLAWLEDHSVVVVREVDRRHDAVLAVILVHLLEDHLHRLLVDAHLSLDHHVVNEADESAKVVVVALGEVQDTLL
jgi:hypothetical protein